MNTKMTERGKQIGAEIRKARKALGWTQVQFAAAIAAERARVSNWERGWHMPDLATLERIAPVLQTTVPALLAAPDESALVSAEQVLSNA